MDLKTKIIYVRLDRVSLHNLVLKEVSQVIAPIAHTFRFPDVITIEGINLVLHSHPIQVLKNKNDSYACIAGIRSYQIAKANLSDEHIVPLIVHQKIDKREIIDLAVLDVLISHTLFGLDSKKGQLDFAKIIKNISTTKLKRFFPAAKSKAAFARLLKTDHRKILTNKKKLEKPISILKSSPSSINE